MEENKLETKKGNVEYISLKFNGGIKLEGEEGWINGTKNSKELITQELRGEQVEIKLDDKGKLHTIEVFHKEHSSTSINPTPESKPVQGKELLNNRDAKIIRQCCVKAAASAVNIEANEKAQAGCDVLMSLAKRMEDYVNGN